MSRARNPQSSFLFKENRPGPRGLQVLFEGASLDRGDLYDDLNYWEWPFLSALEKGPGTVVNAERVLEHGFFVHELVYHYF